MLFEGIRKKLWLSRIKSVVDLSSALENRILRHELHFVYQLAKISKKYDRKDKKDRAVFKISLKLLVEEPSKIDDTMNTGDGIRPFIDQLIQNHAGIITDKMKDELSPRIPDGCIIIDSATLLATVELLLSDINDDEVYSLLIKDIKNNPTKYIGGYNDWLNATAKNIFDAVHDKIQEGIPKGCNVNSSACTDALYSLLNTKEHVDIFENKISYDVVVSKLYEKINENPELYISGYIDLLMNTAKNFFKQIASQLSSSLPNGFCLDEDTSILLLCSLIKKGYEPSNIFEAFINELKKNPRGYIYNLQERLARIISSNSSSTQRDYAMVSSRD